MIDDNTERQRPSVALEASSHPGKGASCEQLAMQFSESSGPTDCVGALPRFDLSEVQAGKILGRGSFGLVLEVRFLDASKDWSGKKVESPFDKSINRRYQKEREFLSTHCSRETSGEARYAVKYLRPCVSKDCDLYPQALLDMAHETRYLAALSHPNICRIRAIGSTGPFHKDYFIVLDRLGDTLERRIEVWKNAVKKKNGKSMRKLFQRMSSSLSVSSSDSARPCNEIERQQLRAAYDLSCAMDYMHLRGIVYRDLKTQNIGFDIRDDIKLFDLGLARDLTKKEKLEDGTYNLTRMTGSPRYMAPEVAIGKPYNTSCDCYSFAVLFWEMYSLKKPYKKLGMDTLEASVWKGSSRPPIPPEWSDPLKVVLQKAWSADINSRPSMGDISDVLRAECRKLDCDEDGLCHSRRRSTFVFQRGSHSASELFGDSSLRNSGKNSSTNTATSWRSSLALVSESKHELQLPLPETAA